LPNTIVRAYYAKVPGAQEDNRNVGGWIFPCTATLPNFVFGVGAARMTIPGAVINLAPITRGGTTCFGGIQSSSQVGINIFGDVALKAAFVVFDGGATPRIGWASKPSEKVTS
jgi:hypothetical protein